MVKVRLVIQTTTLQLNLTQSFNAIIMLHNYTQIVIAFNTKYSKAFFFLILLVSPVKKN